MDADREDLRQRIELAIAKNTFSKAAAAVLDEIAKTHVVIERERWERMRHFVEHVKRRYDEWDDDYNHPSGLDRETIAVNTIEQALAGLQPGDLDDQP